MGLLRTNGGLSGVRQGSEVVSGVALAQGFIAQRVQSTYIEECRASILGILVLEGILPEQYLGLFGLVSGLRRE